MRSCVLTVLTFFLVAALGNASTIETESLFIPDNSSIQRQSHPDGTLLSFQWTDEQIEHWIATVQADPELLQQSEIPLTHRRLIPVNNGNQVRIISVEENAERILLPETISNYFDSTYGDDFDAVTIGNRIMFRDLEAVSVEVTPFLHTGGSWFLVNQIDIILDAPMVSSSWNVTPSFRNAYRMILESDELDAIGQPAPSGGYLIVLNSAYRNYMGAWVDWKRQCGYPVQFIEVTNGQSFSDVRDLVVEAYYASDPHPEFLLLIGDPTSGNATVPGDYIESTESGMIITDHHYVTIEGDDEWPEMWVGRWSVISGTELMTIANKSIAYEKGVRLSEDSDWLSRGLVVCDNTYSSTGITSAWIRARMLEHGFTMVDSVYYPPYQTSDMIVSSIENGRGFVNYRGFGSPVAWVFPIFTSMDALLLNNEFETPIVTSIVCGGGAFDRDADPCLGEAFLRAGTPNAPKGGVAFIGPSELDTHTSWNNCMDMGFYQGMVNEGITTIGPAMFRGKMAIWDGYPNNRQEGDSENSVYFYFDCYNLLGDPGLLMRTAQPEFLSLDVQETLPVGSNDLRVQVLDEDEQPVGGAIVGLAGEEWGPERLISDPDGFVRFDLTDNLPGLGDLIVTAWGYNLVPAQDTVAVEIGQRAVHLDSVYIESDLAGETVSIIPYLSNSGTNSLGECDASLVALEDGISVNTVNNHYDTFAEPGEQAASYPYIIDISDNVEDGFDPGFILNLEFYQNYLVQVRIPFQARADRLEVVNTDIVADGVGVPVSFQLTFENTGSFSALEGTVTLSSDDERVIFVQAEVALPVIVEGSTGTTEASFEVNTALSVYPGERIPINWTYETDNYLSRTETGTIYLIVGELTETDPYGPDLYGYRVFDNTDTSYWNAPTYNWMEIDNTHGGAGIRYNLTDWGDERDESIAQELPFDFTFYGESFDVITVCSNGWLCMGDTGEKNFRNWHLPDGGGPMNIVAPFWDDLVLGNGGVYYYYDEEADRVILEWSRMNMRNYLHADSIITAQAVLYDPEAYPTRTGDGIIEFYYHDFHDNDTYQNYSTIGIRNGDATDGIQVRYASHGTEGIAQPANGRAYRFTTNTMPNTAALRLNNVAIIDDGSNGSEGNNDGFINNGETIAVQVSVRNFGTEDVNGVTLNIAARNEDVQVLQDQVYFGDIAGLETVSSETCLLFEIPTAFQDGQPLVFDVVIEDNSENNWTDVCGFDVRAPLLEFIETSLSEIEGNGDIYVQPGESFALGVNLLNSGRCNTGSLELILETTVNYVEILHANAEIDTLPVGSDELGDPRFEFRLDNSAPAYGELLLPVRVLINSEEFTEDTLVVLLGSYPFLDNFEMGPGAHWTLMNPDWHISQSRVMSGNNSLRWGNLGGLGYNPGRTDVCVSRAFVLAEDGRLEFWAWWDLSDTDYVMVRVSYLSQGVVVLDSLRGTSDGWERLEYTLDPEGSETTTSISFTAVSNDEGAGQGVYIDDIVVFGDLSDAPESDQQLPVTWSLDGPYPNPFNPVGSIVYTLPEPADVNIRVFDILGRQVDVLVHGAQQPGTHTVTWNAESIASGMYFVRMEAGSHVLIRKAVVMK